MLISETHFSMPKTKRDAFGTASPLGRLIN